MKNVLIYNSQAAGDCLLGTHTARLYKKQFPDCKIYFCTRANLTPTTAEGEDETKELLTLLSLQSGIDGVGQIKNTNEGPAVELFGDNIEEQVKFNEVIEQHSWYSNLGIVASQSHRLFDTYGIDNFNDTETSFNVGTDKQIPTDHLVITTPGPLDWNRKTKNESLRLGFLTGLKNFLQHNNIAAKIVLLGRDVENGTLLDSLRKINNSHIFIGPMGLPVHAAAGLDVDTISISSVFPAWYDSPEFYHKGWHRSVKHKLHCGTYACVSDKIYPEQVPSVEGPKTKWGFWPKTCPHTENKLSCVNNTSPEDLLKEFEDWYSNRGINLWNH